MDKRHLAKIKSGIGISNFGSTYATEIAKVSGLPAHFQALQGFVGTSQTVVSKKIVDTSGNTDNKDIQEAALKVLCKSIAPKLHYIAVTTGNAILAKAVSFTDAQIDKLTGVKLVAVAQSLKDNATANLTALAPFAVTTATQTAFQTVINSYNVLIPQAKAVQGTEDNSSEQLKTQLANMDATIEKIDAGMRVLGITNPTLYKEYLTVRKVQNPPVNKRAMAATITDNQGTGIANVVLTLIPFDSKTTLLKKAASKKTSKKGVSVYQNLPEGEYKLTASKAGYKEVSYTISIIAGETLKLAIKMDKTDTNAIVVSE